jgi:hypothetical protein
MITEYLIVLFKNKQRYKLIKKYKTFDNAISFFQKKMKESDSIYFNIEIESDNQVDYELGLIVSGNNKFDTIYITDELGRNIKVETDDNSFKILKIGKYNLPEKITTVNTKERLTFDDFIKKYLRGDSLKMVSNLNNKVIVQNDEKINMFSCKTVGEAERFLSSLEKYMIDNNKRNSIIVRDTSFQQRKYMYELLKAAGFDMKILYRTSTTRLKGR